jgi:methionyl-tRNA formyltransferase
MKEIRVLFFGMLGAFSQPPLWALIEAGFSVVGVVVPTENKAVSVRKLEPVTATSTGSVQAVSHLLLTPKHPNIMQLAWLHHIPVYEVSRLAACETQQTLADLHPDVACVACFNKRIPASLLALPPHGFLNMHPSLLPYFRGPAPLFWTFRAGIAETGVTIHFMDETLDTGDIAQQAPLTLPDGISGAEADRLTGTFGGQLLVNTLSHLADGTLARTPQPLTGSSQPWPQTTDFRIPVSWSARHAFNFMRGTAVFGQPYVVELEAGEIVVQTAVSYTSSTDLSQPAKDHVQIQFADGVVTAVLVN